MTFKQILLWVGWEVESEEKEYCSCADDWVGGFGVGNKPCLCVLQPLSPVPRKQPSDRRRLSRKGRLDDKLFMTQKSTLLENSRQLRQSCDSPDAQMSPDAYDLLDDRAANGNASSSTSSIASSPSSSSSCISSYLRSCVSQP